MVVFSATNIHIYHKVAILHLMQALARFALQCFSFQPYLSLVRPHLEYTSPVWNPYKQKHVVERVELQMATESWECGYQDLLSMADITSPEFKIIHDLCFFPQNMISARSNPSQRTSRQFLLQQPFAHSNAYQHSFVPNTVHAWNLLPEAVINLPFQHFKITINIYIP